MIKRLPCCLFACGTLCIAAPDSPADTPALGDTGAPRHGTITEKTPSISQYFTWINNTNEGATEEQTLINLRFFKWLHDEFGMRRGIYAFDAGAIDSQEFYGRTDSERFRKQFPKGLKEIAELAKSFDCRLGLWGGPDGFGDTPEEEAARTEMLLSLCRDYGFQLFKFDSVCGHGHGLRGARGQYRTKELPQAHGRQPLVVHHGPMRR